MSDAPENGDAPKDAEPKDADPDREDAESGASDPIPNTLNPRKKHASDPPVDPGATLLYESGGSWWTVAIGPVLVAVILVLEIIGEGQIHWQVLLVFGAILTAFAVVQKIAARHHVSMHLTETTLRQGQETVEIADIVKIFPENNGTEPQDWQSAPALGELHGVPRRRKSVGVRLANGRLAQAWARDVDRLRTELTEAHLAVKMGLPPKGKT